VARSTDEAACSRVHEFVLPKTDYFSASLNGWYEATLHAAGPLMGHEIFFWPVVLGDGQHRAPLWRVAKFFDIDSSKLLGLLYINAITMAGRPDAYMP